MSERAQVQQLIREYQAGKYRDHPGALAAAIQELFQYSPKRALMEANAIRLAVYLETRRQEQATQLSKPVGEAG